MSLRPSINRFAEQLLLVRKQQQRRVQTLLPAHRIRSKPAAMGVRSTPQICSEVGLCGRSLTVESTVLRAGCLCELLICSSTLR